MRSSIVAAFAASVAMVTAQDTPDPLLPPPSMAAGCSSTYMDGARFQVGIQMADENSKMIKRQTMQTMDESLMLTLVDGVLEDAVGRFAYIASNDQFQFDNPIQAGALYTTGFSACPNNTIALQTALFYECLTADPTTGRQYYNLYDRSIGDQCLGAFLTIIPETPVSSSSTSTSTSTSTSVNSIGMSTTLTSVLTTPVASSVTASEPTTITSSTVITPISQIPDGQPQVPTSGVLSVTRITAGGSQSTTGGPSIIGTGMVLPTNATSLLPFNSGSPHYINANGGMTFGVIIAGAIALGALLL